MESCWPLLHLVCIACFHELTLPDGQPLVNEYDCPLMDLPTTIFCTAGNNIQRPVSFVHQCSGTCLFKETGGSIRNVEREIVQEDTLIFLSMTGTTLCIAIMSIVHFNNRFLIIAMMLGTKISNNSYQQVLIWEIAFLVMYVISLFQIRHHID